MTEGVAMQRLGLSAATVVALLVPAAAAFAHHGTATSYDQSKLVKVEGVVKEFHWRNPHAGLFLVGKDASGKEVTYSLEMGSPFVLSRLGFTRNTFKPGASVVAEMHPSYGSPESGELFSGRVWVDGKAVVTKPGAPATENYTK
jgi:hypothetical protein